MNKKNQKPKKLTRKERVKIIESVVGKVPWEKFEAGIYNYCDRWCEKCQKTQKCYLFWDEQKEKREQKRQGKDRESLTTVFEHVDHSFKRTFDLIGKISEAEGIDLTMTPEEEAEYEERERQTDPHDEPLYIQANKLYRRIKEWLDEMPSLDIKEYHDAYDNLGWHCHLIFVKVARAIWSKKEAELEDKAFSKFSLQDSKMSGWVAYRSIKICAESLELMDRYVRDPRLAPMARACRELLTEIDKHLL